MKQLFSTFQSRIALAALGAVLCAGMGVAVVVLPGLAHPLMGSGLPSQALANNTTNSSASSTSSPTPPVGTPVDLRGIIQSIAPDGGSFVMSLADGSSQTVIITAQTRFGGDDGASSALLRVGMQVRIRGSMQSDGSVSALSVRVEGGGGDG